MSATYALLSLFFMVVTWKLADRVEPYSQEWWMYLGASAANGASMAIMLS